ncbi:MAG TPA: beta-(1-6) glucans synthase [Pseudolabrys sp.]|nr:beta-(1-6) glucans synthase [Pseudolabrys sp.]
MRLGLACLALSALLIAGFWAWLGTPVAMPNSPLSVGEKLYCLSYSPFRGGQTPLDAGTQISPAQIEDDLTRLAKISDCVRTYSTEFGQDRIAAIAARHGLKVLQGLWLSSHTDKNREQIETAVALANRYPETIRAIVVGNEVLLRGELSSEQLGAIIREVKSRVKVAVTYADVWEFWLRNQDLASAVDFVTIHILPYWEDFPIAARDAGAHVDAIRRRMVAAFPGKEVIIGEVGWPSAGRMREGALPSLANQARVIQDVLALGRRDHFRVNVIEAFDEPWKRALEGTVGGHWGLLDDASRSSKFIWGEAVSNHRLWRWQAAGGIAFALVVFGVSFAARREAPLGLWLVVSANATVGGALIGWSVANVPVESLGAAGWLRSLAFVGVALLVPPTLSAAALRGTPLPRFSRLIGSAAERVRDPLARLTGMLMIAVALLALVVALGLVFNPRYLDFPFAPLTGAVVPLFVHGVTVPRPLGRHGAAEWATAGMVALSVPYIVLNEGFANWQSLWLCAALSLLAFTLARVRAAQS